MEMVKTMLIPFGENVDKPFSRKNSPRFTKYR